MSYKTVEAVLASAVAPGGTFTVSYPAGLNRGDFVRGSRHRMSAGQNDYLAPRDFTIVLGAGIATLTWNGPSTLPAGIRVMVQLDRSGPDSYRHDPDFTSIPLPDRVRPVLLRMIEIGSPIAPAANGIALSQAVGAGGSALLNATLGANPVLDVPRNVVAAWTGAAILTVTGLDEFGDLVVEASASGTSFTGKKAFKRITSAVFSAAVTGATIGFGSVLGLPFYLGSTNLILGEFEDAATATAGTRVAALGQGTKSTSTTGDVRGTYTPSSTPDGSKAFSLLAVLTDPSFRGSPQFAG